MLERGSSPDEIVQVTALTDSRVAGIDHDPATKRATGVRVLDTRNKAGRTPKARLIFLCAGSFNSVGLPLQSRSEAYPEGLGNHNDMLGRFIMDHASALQGLRRAATAA